MLIALIVLQECCRSAHTVVASSVNMEQQARRILEAKTKPSGSLGLLEDWAVRLSLIHISEPTRPY